MMMEFRLVACHCSERLDYDFPPGVVREFMKLEDLAFVEGRQVEDVNLTSLRIHTEEKQLRNKYQTFYNR